MIAVGLDDWLELRLAGTGGCDYYRRSDRHPCEGGVPSRDMHIESLEEGDSLLDCLPRPLGAPVPQIFCLREVDIASRPLRNLSHCIYLC